MSDNWEMTATLYWDSIQAFLLSPPYTLRPSSTQFLQDTPTHWFFIWAHLHAQQQQQHCHQWPPPPPPHPSLTLTVDVQPLIFSLQLLSLLLLQQQLYPTWLILRSLTLMIFFLFFLDDDDESTTTTMTFSLLPHIHTLPSSFSLSSPQRHTHPHHTFSFFLSPLSSPIYNTHTQSLPIKNSLINTAPPFSFCKNSRLF